jgi:hypothetical protein
LPPRNTTNNQVIEEEVKLDNIDESSIAAPTEITYCNSILEENKEIEMI